MHIDTLSITGKIPSAHLPQFEQVPEDWAWKRVLELFPCLSAHLAVIGKPMGRMNGYTNAWAIQWDGEIIGHLAAGGNEGGPSSALRAREKGVQRLQSWQVYLNGLGCALVSSQEGAWGRAAEMVHRRRYRITRVDIAHDDLSGVRSVDWAAEQYLAGAFQQKRGGRVPSVSQAGNWLTPDGRGRTLYVGARGGLQMLRVYEKGKQLGDAGHPWVRWEVEFHHDSDYPIPARVLLEYEAYFCGAYPCLASFGSGACRRESVREAVLVTYAALKKHAAVAYGRLVWVMETLGEDVTAALTHGVKAAPPRRMAPLAALAGLYPPPGSNTGGNLSPCGAV